MGRIAALLFAQVQYVHTSAPWQIDRNLKALNNRLDMNARVGIVDQRRSWLSPVRLADADYGGPSFWPCAIRAISERI